MPSKIVKQAVSPEEYEKLNQKKKKKNGSSINSSNGKGKKH